jgi:hypothetical protein
LVPGERHDRRFEASGRGEAHIVRAAESPDGMVTALYPVERLLIARPGFKAPDLEIDGENLFGPGGAKAGIRENDDNGDRGRNDFGSPDDLVGLIKSVVAPGTWGEGWEEGKGSISVARGILIVRHTVKVQREIARLLAQLGA